jgi:hypothetical protein
MTSRMAAIIEVGRAAMLAEAQAIVRTVAKKTYLHTLEIFTRNQRLMMKCLKSAAAVQIPTFPSDQ